MYVTFIQYNNVKPDTFNIKYKLQSKLIQQSSSSTFWINTWFGLWKSMLSHLFKECFIQIMRHNSCILGLTY